MCEEITRQLLAPKLLKKNEKCICSYEVKTWSYDFTISDSYDFIKCVSNNIEIKNSKIEKVTDPHVVWLREQFYVCITEYSFA